MLPPAQNLSLGMLLQLSAGNHIQDLFTVMSALVMKINADNTLLPYTHLSPVLIDSSPLAVNNSVVCLHDIHLRSLLTVCFFQAASTLFFQQVFASYPDLVGFVGDQTSSQSIVEARTLATSPRAVPQISHSSTNRLLSSSTTVSPAVPCLFFLDGTPSNAPRVSFSP